MDPGHVLALGVGLFDHRHDLVQGHGRRVHDQGVLGRVGDHRLGHQGAGVEHHRGGGDQVAPAEREQVRRARPGADEVHGHPGASRALSSFAP